MLARTDHGREQQQSNTTTTTTNGLFFRRASCAMIAKDARAYTTVHHTRTSFLLPPRVALPLSYVWCGDGEPPLIPLKIHHIWLGSPLPEAFARLRESWLARHGGHSSQGSGHERSNSSSIPWEVRLWTDADINAFGLENRGAYDAAQNFGQKSDILRYEVGRVRVHVCR